MNIIYQLSSGLQHIGIPTKEIDLTTKFYQRLGFQIVYQTMNELAHEKVIFLKLGNLMLEIYENKNATLKSGAIDHIALNVSDIKKAFEWAESEKLVLLDKQIQTLPFWENGVSFFTIEGPNKEKIEFCQYL
jgi:lactoylglutathione lyase